ncbi:hypothetical protein GCM10009602_06310 [Nocardiopsis tropica]
MLRVHSPAQGPVQMGKDLAETLARRAAIDQMSRRPARGRDAVRQWAWASEDLAFRLFPNTL